MWTHKTHVREGYNINRKDKAFICYIPISKVEAVWRTVVAWRWSIAHLIRHIWPGRTLLEERQRGYFHKDGNIKDSILLSYHIHAVATPLTSAHQSCWEEETGHGFSTFSPSGLSGGQIDSSCAFHISPISQSLSPNNTGPKCAQL